MAIIILVLGSYSIIYAKETSISFNDKDILIPIKYQNNKAMVPASDLSKLIDASISWIPETKSFTIEKDDITVLLYCGKNVALVNGKEVGLGCTVTAYNGKNFIPLRCLAEIFGGTVKWNAKSNTINITYIKLAKISETKRLPAPWEINKGGK